MRNDLAIQTIAEYINTIDKRDKEKRDNLLCLLANLVLKELQST